MKDLPEARPEVLLEATVPTVSVLLPAYNHAQFIGQSISSALAQSYGDLELIVVDDGSTDSTRDEVLRFDDPRVRYVRQSNGGVARALTVAFALSRGSLVAILNDDDVWLPDKLQVQLQGLAEHPQAGLVYGRVVTIDAEGAELPHLMSVAPRFPGQILKSLLYHNCIVPATVMVRRECLEKVGLWDESLSGADDWDMWLRLARHYEFLFQDRIVARYRFHAGNASGSQSATFVHHQERRVRVLDKFFADDCRPEDRAMKSVAYRNLYILVALQYFAAGSPQRALDAMLRAVRADPRPAALLRAASALTLNSLSHHRYTRNVVSYIGRVRMRQRVEMLQKLSRVNDR